MYFKNIIGHEKQLNQLRRDLAGGSLAHAYLLAGPTDLGKFTIAKAFAKAIQTEGMNDEDAFRVSAQIDRGIHADTIILPRLPDEDTIKIATIRLLLANLQMTGDSMHRILMMEDVDRMTTEAANAMLKMLEEPPSKVLYIFTTSHPNMMLETILSRVRRVDFSIFNDEDLLRSLGNRFRLVGAEQLKRVSELSMGRIAKAIKLLENQEMLDAYENIYLQISDFLIKKDISSGFAFVAQIHADPLLTKIFLEIVSVVLREALKKSVQAGDSPNIEFVLAQLERVTEVRRLAETNVNNRLLLENFILSL